MPTPDPAIPTIISTAPVTLGGSLILYEVSISLMTEKETIM
jgi:hypothetical protein